MHKIARDDDLAAKTACLLIARKTCRAPAEGKRQTLTLNHNDDEAKKLGSHSGRAN